MRKFKISIQRGLLFAPAMIVYAENHEKAVKDARHSSGLGRFEEWSFEAIEINQNH